MKYTITLYESHVGILDNTSHKFIKATGDLKIRLLKTLAWIDFALATKGDEAFHEYLVKLSIHEPIFELIINQEDKK